MHDLAQLIAIIGVAGIGAQWLAWRLRLPAIVLLFIAGVLLGPVSEILDPAEDFGSLFKPLVALSVALILFEGGLTLKFGEIHGAGAAVAVRRLVLVGAPLGWILGALAARYVAGLDWPAATILGGLFVVTGPTVIMPLLRQAKLKTRPAALLKWEAIINDPVGALFAVIAFEVVVVSQTALSPMEFFGKAALALIVALGGGWLLARALIVLFSREWVPEYLKAPTVLAAVLAGYEISQLFLEESGLATVTVMGVLMANSRVANLSELQRFKETITVLLVSGVFILLTATLDRAVLAALDWRAAAFVAAMLLIVRPATILTATIGAGLEWRERLLVAWIAPRGVVAVAVAGFFGAALTDLGLEGGAQMSAIAFLLVATTVVLHGFTLGPAAQALGLRSAEAPGVLIVGGGVVGAALAERIMALGAPVMVADRNFSELRRARQVGAPTFAGEILSEAAEHSLAFNAYGALLAVTRNDAYNALVCTDFGPEFGRGAVYQLRPIEDGSERRSLSFTLGGRPLFEEGLRHEVLEARLRSGWRFKITNITESHSLAAALAANSRPGEAEATPILVQRAAGALIFATGRDGSTAAPGDKLLLLAPPER